jgi:hypothetical protein
MEFRIWIETRLGERVLERELVAPVERTAAGIGPEEIGLSQEEARPCSVRCRLALSRRRPMHGEPLTGDAFSGGESSALRIDEPAVCERFSVQLECPAAAISAAGVEAEKNHVTADRW